MSNVLSLNITRKLTLENLGKIVFSLYVFFVLFGVSLPFQSDYESVEDIATANPFRQLVFATLYLFAFFSLSNKWNRVLEIIKSEKFAMIFLFWAMLSVGWSDYSIVSFKRWIQVFGAYIVILAGLLNYNDIESFLNVVKKIFILYIIVNVISVVFVPAATMYEGAWRGIAPHKNHFGQIMLISTIIWYDAFYKETENRIYNLLFLVLSIGLLIGSRSTTSVLTAILILFFAIVIYTKNFINRNKYPIGNIFLAIFILSFFLIVILIPTYLITPIDYFFNSLGKDLTFTGRTDLWARVLQEFKHHWITGAGFQGFWVVNNPALNSIYAEFIWLPMQSHSGYVDLLNEVGIIGFIIFLLMVVQYFYKRSRIFSKDNWAFILTSVLILNFQESSIFRTNVVSGIFFLMAYLKMFYIKSEIFNAES